MAGTADASEGHDEDDNLQLGGISDALAGALDPQTFRPRLNEGVEVVVFRLRWGDGYAMIATPDRTVHYQIEPWEAELLEGMDGTQSVSELIVERLQEDGDLDTGAVLSLVDLLRTGGFLGSAPLSRIVADLQRRGIVKRDGHRYSLKKVAALAKIADL